jgi:hypothetical protein
VPAALSATSPLRTETDAPSKAPGPLRPAINVTLPAKPAELSPLDTNTDPVELP